MTSRDLVIIVITMAIIAVCFFVPVAILQGCAIVLVPCIVVGLCYLIGRYIAEHSDLTANTSSDDRRRAVVCTLHVNTEQVGLLRAIILRGIKEGTAREYTYGMSILAVTQCEADHLLSEAVLPTIDGV